MTFADRRLAVGAEALQDVRIAPALEARIRYDIGDGAACWRETIGDGRVVWSDDAVAEPDVTIRWPDLDVARDVLTRRIGGDAATLATTMVDRRAGGTYVGLPPPFDVNGQPDLARMPQVDGADVRFAVEVTHGPFGTAHGVLVFERGICLGIDPGAEPEPDAAASLTFVNLIRMRQGSIDFLHAIDGGSVGGSQGALALLAGLLAAPEYKQALRATVTGRGSAALGVLATVAAEPAYRAAMEYAFAATDG